MSLLGPPPISVQSRRILLFEIDIFKEIRNYVKEIRVKGHFSTRALYVLTNLP